MNLKKITELIPLLLPILILCSYLRLYVFYDNWNIPIINYLSSTELVFSFLEPLVIIIVLTIIAIISHFLIGLFLDLFQNFKDSIKYIKLNILRISTLFVMSLFSIFFFFLAYYRPSVYGIVFINYLLLCSLIFCFSTIKNPIEQHKENATKIDEMKSQIDKIKSPIDQQLFEVERIKFLSNIIDLTVSSPKLDKEVKEIIINGDAMNSKWDVINRAFEDVKNKQNEFESTVNFLKYPFKSLLPSIIITLISVSIFMGRFEIKKVLTNKRSYKVSLKDGTSLETTNKCVFLGRTSKYYYFYDSLEFRSIIYPIEEIKSFSIKNNMQ